MLHTYYHMQLHVPCNLFYATTEICSCMCRMQLNFSCMRQLQNPKFLVVYPTPLQMFAYIFQAYKTAWSLFTALQSQVSMSVGSLYRY